MTFSGHYPKPECLCLQLLIFIFEFSLDLIGICGTHLDFCKFGPKEKFWICRYFSSSALQLFFLPQEWYFTSISECRGGRRGWWQNPRLKAVIQMDKISIPHSAVAATLPFWPCFGYLLQFPLPLGDRASPLSQFLPETAPTPGCPSHFHSLLTQKKGLSPTGILGGQACSSSNNFPKLKHESSPKTRVKRSKKWFC